MSYSKCLTHKPFVPENMDMHIKAKGSWHYLLSLLLSPVSVFFTLLSRTEVCNQFPAFVLSCLSLGEIVVNEVNFVRKCINAESSQDDLWGKLICTNFKVSFIPQDDLSKQVFLLI